MSADSQREPQVSANPPDAAWNDYDRLVRTAAMTFVEGGGTGGKGGDGGGGGTKFDAGKTPTDLLPPDALIVVAKVLQFGAVKYAPRNWEKGMAWMRLYASALRHLFWWAIGERNDPETGLPHVAHAMCCCMFLTSYEVRGIGDDDRATLSRAVLSRMHGMVPREPKPEIAGQ